MDFVLNFAKIKRKMWSLYKFGRVIAFLGLFYQIISVTISYLEFETVIDMKAVSGIEQRPALTFCLYSDREFPKRTRNPVMQKKFGNSFGCSLLFPNIRTEEFECDHLCKLVESNPFLSSMSFIIQSFIGREADAYESNFV
jgi:hypothetical protein